MSATPFQAILQKALADYSGQVGIDLDKHPFNDELRGCDSPEGVVKLFEDKMKGFKVDRYGNCKLTNWLSPVVQVIHALSGVLGEAVAPFQPTKAILVGIDVLITATDGVGPSYDALLDLFECIENSLKRLHIYTNLNIPVTLLMTHIFINILVELLSVFALATKQIKPGRLKKFAKKVLGDSKIEVVLQRLDRLTQDGAAHWQTLEVVHELVNNPKVVINDDNAQTDGMQAAMDIMDELARQRQDMETIWERQAEVLRQQADVAKREIELAKREIEVQRAEQEAQLREREARLKDAELSLKEDVLRTEQEALRIEEEARRMIRVTKWKEKQPLELEKRRRSGEGWMGTKRVVVSAWGKFKGRISRADERNTARIFQDKDEDQFNGNGIGVGSSSSTNTNTDPEVSALSTVPGQTPRHMDVEQRRSTSVTSPMSDVGNMPTIQAGDDQEELGSVSRAVTSERETSAETSAEYTVRSINSYKERLHRSPEYFRRSSQY